VTPAENDVPDPKIGWVTGINRLLVYFSGVAVAGAEGSGRDWMVAGYSVAAIVVSAAAIEATVGEFLAYPKNQTLFKVEIDEWSRTLPRPYEVVKTIVRKKAGKDVGTLVWYDRMRCLFELRNLLVHYRPQARPVGTFPPELADCVRKHGLEPSGDDSMDWTSRVIVPDVAAQAAAIAQAAIDGFLNEVES